MRNGTNSVVVSGFFRCFSAVSYTHLDVYKRQVYGWETKHTVVEGRRLKFNGTAIQLFGNWIKWLLLCIITLGIYGFWLSIALKKWKVKHTEFAD